MKKIMVSILTFFLLLSGAVSCSASLGEFKPNWEGFQDLLDKDQLRAALDLAATMREQAQAADDQANWTRALVEEVKLNVSLGAVETAAEHLLTHEWPGDPQWRNILALYRAQALVQYLNRYSWEARSRESQTQPSATDVSTWSVDQIDAEINRTFAGVWDGRQSWTNRGLEDMSLYLEQNTYPARIRGTLRDAVTYLWADFLVDSSYWSPQESNGVFRLDLAQLMDGDRALADEALDPGAAGHPLQRLSFILADLRQWHLADGRVEAAHEAQLELLRHLRDSFTNEVDQLSIRQKLETLQTELDPGLPWWSYGQWRLADFLLQEGQPGGRVQAHLAAQRGARRHPNSPGGQLCARVVAEIEAPYLMAEGMAQDAAGKRSILINHQNLERVYLRAWRFDREDSEPLRQRLLDPPQSKEILAWIESGDRDLAWTVDLPVTADYELHRTYTALPPCAPGPYVVVVSTRKNFAPQHNQFVSLNILVSDLVLQVTPTDEGFYVQSSSGATGQAIPGVKLEILGKNRGSDELETLDRLQTDSLGRAALSGQMSRFSILARAGDHLALMDRLWPQHYRNPQQRQQCLLYTDRSIYRPGQTVFWKAVLYSLDRVDQDNRVSPDSPLEVILRDANYQEVARFKGVTNGFGSASGQFVLPTGGLLGRWILEVPHAGSTSIMMEEYKRPTFEVALEDLSGQPRLNQPVILQGKATYYFGQPVTEGKVTWRVARTPTYKSWPMIWPRSGPQELVTVIATGDAELSPEGTFTIDFTTEVDSRLAEEPQASFRFSVEAEVTNTGGETRNGTRSYRLGFTGVEATITGDRDLLVAGEKGYFTVGRTNLDGAPQAGSGTWRVMALQQPTVTPLPAEIPWDLPRGQNPLMIYTAGDTLRPRWQPGQYGLPQTKDWPDGTLAGQGTLDHGPDGQARLPVADLAPGAYRLHYETADELGHLATATHEFLVAGAAGTPLAMPLILLPEQSTVRVGEVLRVLIHSGLPDQQLRLQIFQKDHRLQNDNLVSGAMDELLEIPITENLRGGFTLQVSGVRDYQPLEMKSFITVPWDNKDLKVEFLSFRDLLVPGTDESFSLRVTGPDSMAVAQGTVEVLAFMYDRSLDLFARHDPPLARSLFRQNQGNNLMRSTLGWANSVHLGRSSLVPLLPPLPVLSPDRLLWRQESFQSRHTLALSDALAVPAGGLRTAAMSLSAPPPMAEAKGAFSEETLSLPSPDSQAETPGGLDAESPTMDQPLRENFTPTAFFAPHVMVDADGVAIIEFKVPDAVTDWNLWALAMTPDLSSGSAHRTISSRKDLLVRPYLPRFLREGDTALLKVLVNNSGESELSGQVRLSLTDPVTGEDRAREFGFTDAKQLDRTFTVAAGGSTDLSFNLAAPTGVGSVVCKVVATTENLSDGEQHLLPVLPGRLHLMQSRFVTLNDQDHRTMTFDDLAAQSDASLTTDQLVVTVDAQLFQGVLAALPYLVDYPYECTEQTLNRFLSTTIISGVFNEHPAIKQMAAQLAARDTRLPAWNADDPNRKTLLEETPWLVQSRGGRETPDQLINILDPETAQRNSRESLAKLEKMQAGDGGFPWWSGGQSSPYLTLYVLQGFSRAREFGVDIPTQIAGPAWRYLHDVFLHDMAGKLEDEVSRWPLATFLNYLLSGLPADELASTGFTADDRRLMLDYSFAHWQQHSRLLKGQLALTLSRDGRADDARLVVDSVMDRALSDHDLGTYWAPEDHAWLWYNDTVEAHAFLLRVLTELDPKDSRRQGLVQWLFLNRQLGHWKSTRATAEVVYALVHYLQQEDALGVPEKITVTIGDRRHDLVFDPAEYTGQDNHIVVPGLEVDPAEMSTITVAKETPGLAFASATWHFSTDEMPSEAEGDLLGVTRQYFRRFQEDGKWKLAPMGPDEVLQVGDQVEVQLEISARQAAEYVHLRDPRGAGFEPEDLTSGYHWDGGLGHYREIRDSGANFFFDRLPTGKYTLRYRLRATMAGQFKVAPAVLQSMYAPEFTAYSAGGTVSIGR